jgi:hypothetical protein
MGAVPILRKSIRFYLCVSAWMQPCELRLRGDQTQGIQNGLLASARA